MSRSTEEQDSAKSRGRPEGLPKRWSAQRKAEVVLRLLRGEEIGEVSREVRGCAAGVGAVATGVPGRWPAGAEEEEPAGRGADADPGEAGGDDDAGRAAGGASRKKGVRGRAAEALEALGRVSPATNRPYPGPENRDRYTGTLTQWGPQEARGLGSSVQWMPPASSILRRFRSACAGVALAFKDRSSSATQA